MENQILVRVVAVTQFLGVPAELYDDELPEDTNHGTDMEQLTELAGRVCYDSYRAPKHRDSISYHQHIKEVGHGSVTEHASISFYIAGISRNLTHELVRHAAGCGKSQRSTRYCDETASPIAWHPLLEKALDTADWEMLNDLTDSCRHAYTHLMEKCQNYLASRGVKALDAKKQARGAARGILPSALSTGMIWTVNTRALRFILGQRCQNAADAEIRQLMCLIYAEAYKHCPQYLNDFVIEPAADGIGFCLKTEFPKI